MYDLKPFARDVFLIEGQRVRDTGIWFDTRMCVIKLSSGALWLNSRVPIPPATVSQVKALGRVGFLVAATPRHAWRLQKAHELFPVAELWVTPQINSRFKLMMVLPEKELRFDGILDNDPPAAWADDMDQLLFLGNRLIKEVFFFHRKSGTLIMDDMIQSHPAVKGKPFLNTLMKLEGAATGWAVGRDIRWTFTNRKAARQSLERLLSWDFDKLVIAHGPCIEKNAKQVVEVAFHWLMH
jgi:Domain of unknown function (DUF4336)